MKCHGRSPCQAQEHYTCPSDTSIPSARSSVRFELGSRCMQLHPVSTNLDRRACSCRTQSSSQMAGCQRRTASIECHLRCACLLRMRYTRRGRRSGSLLPGTFRTPPRPSFVFPQGTGDTRRLRHHVVCLADTECSLFDRQSWSCRPHRTCRCRWCWRDPTHTACTGSGRCLAVFQEGRRHIQSHLR